MDLYNATACRFARELTLKYSSSFGLGSRLFSSDIRPHIYAIYGLVRIADEIVDTYQSKESSVLLDQLEADVKRAIRLGYSANLIVQAFALTARKYDFDVNEIGAFYQSMRMDLTDTAYTPGLYQTYIHGSAEAVGLLCLSVFCANDAVQYNRLKTGAAALGAAYQKVNFLRDIGSDYKERGRIYFPGYDYDTFDEVAKHAVIKDIMDDFQAARLAINQLPASSRVAVLISYQLYSKLLAKLRATPIEQIKQGRVRVSTPGKVWLAAKTVARGRA